MRRFALALSTLVAVVATVAIGVAPPAHAVLGLRDQADPEPWMTNGKVYAQALSEDGDTLYIGGRFNSVRENPPGTPGRTLAVNNVAAIDVTSGAPISAWRPEVAGDAEAAPVVRALEVRNGRVYIGGMFTSVDGQPRRNLAAVDAASGALETAFAPSVGDTTSFVYALAADDARLYMGGRFSSVDGKSRGNIAAVDASSGALDAAWRARANNIVRDLEFGKNADGSTDGTIFAAGGFNSVSSGTSGPIARQSVARFDASTSEVHPWAVPAGQVQTDSRRNNNMTCWNETVTPTRLFLNCGLGPNFTGSYRLDNGDSGDRVWSWGFGGNPQASAMSPDGSRLIVGGHFGINPIKRQVCGKPLGGLIALDPANGAVDCSSNWVPHLDQDKDPSYDGAWTILSTDQHVWVGGGFAGVSGQPRTNLARFTFNTAADATAPETTIASGPSGYVNSTSVSFAFSSSEAGSTFQCSRDGASFAACTSPESYSSHSQYNHTFQVRAIDEAGNIDASPATRSWFTDTVIPKGTISINRGAASTASRSVTLRLSASDPSPASGVAYMRFRNGGTTTWSSWLAYSTSKSWRLTAGAGTKTVYVQYKDRAGNVSAAASDTIRFSP